MGFIFDTQTCCGLRKASAIKFCYQNTVMARMRLFHGEEDPESN